MLNNIQYNANDQILARGFGNGLTESRLYDLQGRLLNQSLGGTEQTAFGYDAESNLLTGNSAIFTHSYQYDPLNHLSRESNDQSDPIDYLYDPNGNRLETIDNQIVQQDAAGNLTLDAQGRSFVYNQAGRLAKIRVTGALIAESRSDGNPIRDYIRLVEEPVAQTATGSS